MLRLRVIDTVKASRVKAHLEASGAVVDFVCWVPDPETGPIGYIRAMWPSGRVWHIEELK